MRVAKGMTWQEMRAKATLLDSGACPTFPAVSGRVRQMRASKQRLR